MNVYSSSSDKEVGVPVLLTVLFLSREGQRGDTENSFRVRTRPTYPRPRLRYIQWIDQLFEGLDSGVFRK